MSVQLFIQAKLLGIDEFLCASPATPDADSDVLFLGRHYYVTLLMEVLPRAVLDKLGLSRILLGASGSGRFLILIPEPSREAAEVFLTDAAQGIRHLSGGQLELTWGVTENLGAWADVRKRLETELRHQRGTVAVEPWTFDVGVEAAPPADEAYLRQLATDLREAKQVNYDPASAGMIRTGFGAYTFTLNEADGVPLVYQAALDENGQPRKVRSLAKMATGQKRWGVLRAELDHFELRLRRSETIEDHIQVSIAFRQFFAGETALLTSAGEFFQKITVLYSGQDGFAVMGPWDALIAYASEFHRVFERFSQEQLKDLVGNEARTMSMALALSEPGDQGPDVYARATENLRRAKIAGRDHFYLLGRAIEWPQLASASELREDLVRIIRNYHYPAGLLLELGRFYREQSNAGPRRGRLERLERPWRFYRRVSTAFGDARTGKHERMRSDVISDFIGKNTAQARLRPAGRVALEWASLTLDNAVISAAN